MVNISQNSNYLLAHRHRHATVAPLRGGNTMHAPRAAHGNKLSVQINLDLHSYPVHMQRYQRRRLTQAVDVRLVARNVRIFHDFRVGNHRVHHRSLRKKRLRRPRHRQRIGDGLLAVENPLGEAEAVLNAAGKLGGHFARGDWVAAAMVVSVELGCEVSEGHLNNGSSKLEAFGLWLLKGS